MGANKGMRKGMIIAVSLVVLMLGSSIVVAQESPTIPQGEDIDYTRELIEVNESN